MRFHWITKIKILTDSPEVRIYYVAIWITGEVERLRNSTTMGFHGQSKIYEDDTVMWSRLTEQQKTILLVDQILKKNIISHCHGLPWLGLSGDSLNNKKKVDYVLVWIIGEFEAESFKQDFQWTRWGWWCNPDSLKNKNNFSWSIIHSPKVVLFLYWVLETAPLWFSLAGT